MAIIEVLDSDSLEQAIYANESNITVKGDLSQHISKGLNAYHKYKSVEARCLALGGGAAGTVMFGPVGWLISAGATAGLLFAIKQKKEAEEAFRTMPYSYLARDLGKKNYVVTSNNGNEVSLFKKP